MGSKDRKTTVPAVKIIRERTSRGDRETRITGTEKLPANCVVVQMKALERPEPIRHK
jgi:hypothetical protein